MSPASYQTAPPRVANCVAFRLSVRRSDGPTVRQGRAGNGTRTRDPNLGKVVLYQLSYSRVSRADPKGNGPGLSGVPNGGEGDRTPDLVNAIHALSQLSYAPAILAPPPPAPPCSCLRAGTRPVNRALWRCQA